MIAYSTWYARRGELSVSAWRSHTHARLDHLPQPNDPGLDRARCDPCSNGWRDRMVIDAGYRCLAAWRLRRKAPRVDWSLIKMFADMD